MPSMSYCMFENTASEMDQVVDAMEEAETFEDLELNEYEQQGFEAMAKLCVKFLKEVKRLQENSDA